MQGPYNQIFAFDPPSHNMPSYDGTNIMLKLAMPWDI